MTSRRQFLAALGSTALASAVWVPSVSTVFAPGSATLDGDPDDPVIAGLIEAQLAIAEGGRMPWETMRFTNPEWDLMGRTFTGLGLLAAMRAKPELSVRVLPAVSRIIQDTLGSARDRGKEFFLMGYARLAPFLNPDRASLFIDGEMLALVAAREAIVGDGRFATEQRELARRVRSNMDASPIGHGESYPDECWAVCNAFAALGLQLDARTTGRDHTRALQRYAATTHSLIQTDTGMLHSEYTYAGHPMDGPEGSSIYLTAALLDRLEPGWGRHQYHLASEHLLRSFLGFGYSREWKGRGVIDVDSGPIVPGFEAGSAASGLAIIAAAAFEDRDALQGLLASLWACAFPTWKGDALHFAASNAVGDSAMLFGLLQNHLDLGRTA